MSKSAVSEADWLKLLFNATAIANLADNAATSPLTNLAVALHTADPGNGGTQSTNETTYTGYGRVNVARTTGGWAVTGSGPTGASPVAAINFPVCTAGALQTITHFSVGATGGGASRIFYSGAVTPNLAVTSGVTPQLTTDTIITEE